MKKFDKHYVQGNIRCKSGLVGGCTDTDGNISRLWERLKSMADSEVTGWTFWVTLRRGPIEVQAHGDENYTIVLQRAERILLAAEAAHEREHGGVANVA